MTDYSKLSDFEINSAVHNAKLSEPYSLVFMGDDRIAWTKENGDKIITDKVPYTKNGVHDYCNNPADAWPIIVGNLISVEPDYEFIDPSEEQVFASGAWISEHYDGIGGLIQHVEINPLRAAMIVFLMMQDKK